MSAERQLSYNGRSERYDSKREGNPSAQWWSYNPTCIETKGTPASTSRRARTNDSQSQVTGLEEWEYMNLLPPARYRSSVAGFSSLRSTARRARPLVHLSRAAPEHVSKARISPLP